MTQHHDAVAPIETGEIDQSLNSPLPRMRRAAPLDRKSATTLDHIEVTKGENLHTLIKLLKYEVQKKNSDGEKIGEPYQRLVHFRPEQDVLDTAFWYHDRKGEIRIVKTERERPVLVLRNDDFHPDGLQWNLPGVYYVESSDRLSVDNAVRELAARLELVPLSNEIEVLGGSYAPNADSPERGYPFAIEIEDPNIGESERAIHGEDLRQQITVTTERALDVISNFLQKKTDDLRLVECTLRLMLAKEPEKLAALLAKETPIKTPPVKNTKPPRIPILTKDQFRTVTDGNKEIASRLERNSLDLLPDDYLTAVRMLAQNKNAEGATLGNPDGYPFDAILRKHFDSLSAQSFFIYNGIPYLVVNIGVRVAQLERNAVIHLIDSKIDPKTVEGIFTSLNHQIPWTELKMRATRLLENEWGLTLRNDAVEVGHGTQSPGYDPCKLNLFLAEVNPAYCGAQFPKNAFAIDLPSILQLIETGEIQSLELTLAAHLLAGQFSISADVNRDTPVDKVAAKELALLFNSASPKIQQIAKHSPLVFNKLCASGEGRRALYYFANHCKMAFSDDPVDRELFDAASHVAPINTLAEEGPAGFLMQHDFMHSFLKEPFPFYRDANGNFIKTDGGHKMWSFEDFRFVTLCNESDAVWYSEVYLPQTIGIEPYEEICGEISIARIFSECGIHGRDAERRAIRSMIIDGKIPPEIANSPNYANYRNVVLTKLIGYHIRDAQHNTRLMYEHWKNNPRMAEALARVRGYGNPPDQNARDLYSTNSIEKLITYNRGQNRLLEDFTEIQSRKIMPLLSKLAFFIQHAETNGRLTPLLKDARKNIDALVAGYQTLSQLSESIVDRELNATNVNAFEQRNVLLNETIVHAKKFIASLTRLNVPELLPLKDKQFPASPRIPFYMPADLQELLLECEAKSLRGTRNEHFIGSNYR